MWWQQQNSKSSACTSIGKAPCQNPKSAFRLITASLFLLFSLLATASTESWRVRTINHSDFLIRNNKQKFALPSSHTTPKVKFVKKHGDYEVVIYFADVLGTSEMFELTKAAVYSISKKSIVQHLPYSYTSRNGVQKNTEQPKWTFNKDGSITYRSVEFPDSPIVFPAKK